MNWGKLMRSGGNEKDSRVPAVFEFGGDGLNKQYFGRMDRPAEELKAQGFSHAKQHVLHINYSSATHFCIKRAVDESHPGGYSYAIEDLSRNGTKLNEELIGSGLSRAIKSGDVVGIKFKSESKVQYTFTSISTSVGVDSVSKSEISMDMDMEAEGDENKDKDVDVDVEKLEVEKDSIQPMEIAAERAIAIHTSQNSPNSKNSTNSLNKPSSSARSASQIQQQAEMQQAEMQQAEEGLELQEGQSSSLLTSSAPPSNDNALLIKQLQTYEKELQDKDTRTASVLLQVSPKSKSKSKSKSMSKSMSMSNYMSKSMSKSMSMSMSKSV